MRIPFYFWESNAPILSSELIIFMYNYINWRFWLSVRHEEPVLEY